MTDEPLTTCPECNGHIRRVLFPAGVVFKGSGFYKTDYNGNKASSSTTSETDGKKAETGTNGENKTSTESKAPAESKTPEKSTPSATTNSTAATKEAV
jgi:predicted nucleic acid-binding Zn ribbon protein